MQKVKGYLRLMRPANLVTAVADVLAGIAIANYFSTGFSADALPPVLWLCLSTIGLYGGGVVLNDVFDAALDAVERPERPIPSGLISKKSATILGVLLLLLGIGAAAFVHYSLGSISVGLAVAIAVASVVYDGWAKHHSFLGPLNMGLCRGLNLALGMSILSIAVQQYWYLGIVPVIYIAAITVISRGEVHGGSKRVLYFAALLYIVVFAAVFAVAYLNGNALGTLPFLLLLVAIIFPPLLKAVQSPVGPRIGKAVKAGVIALIVLNAAWAAAFGAVYLALVIILLLPLSLLLARLFAVT